MKQSRIMRASSLVCVLALSACSEAPNTVLSPTGVEPSVTFVNPDGSTVKVTAPRDLGPSGGITIATLRPILTFTNPSARFAPVGFAYDIEIQNAAGAVLYDAVIGETPNSGSHELVRELSFADFYWWRVRARLGTQVGPWSDFAPFRTPNPPPPPPPPPVTPPVVTPPVVGTGGLPFPIPAACGPGDPSNRIPCVFAMSALSAEWASCARGSGVACHRFTRQVVYAMAQFDPGWQMIIASPGGTAYNCTTGGPGLGNGATFLREDTTVYSDGRVFDMIGGAGGPAPVLQWLGPFGLGGQARTPAVLCP